MSTQSFCEGGGLYRETSVSAQLRDCRPYLEEIGDILNDPNQSDILKGWLGVQPGDSIQYLELKEDNPHVKDPSWREGAVLNQDDLVVWRFTLRAELPSALKYLVAKALGSFTTRVVQPRGHLSGSITPIFRRFEPQD